MAAELEQACQKNASTPVIRSLLERLLVELSSVITGLARIGAGETVPTEASVILDMTKVQPLLDQLAAQLTEIDSEAYDTVQELLSLTKDSSLASALQKIASAVTDYEFEEAEIALRALQIAVCTPT
ncbi:hypothetical protein CCP3SC1_880001 [Gammaproteobacteria bacterium]